MTPGIPIVLELGKPLAGMARAIEARALERRTRADIDALLRRLGLDSDVGVEVKPVASTRPVRVRVHDELQPYSPNLMLRAWLAVAPPELRSLPTTAVVIPASGFPTCWLTGYVEEIARSPVPDWSLAAAFVERLALQTVMKHPSCLLDDAQLERYATRIDAPLAEVEAVLPALLELGVSVTDDELVKELLLEGRQIQRTLDDTVEAIFIELRSHRVEIHVNSGTLSALFRDCPNAPFSVYDPVVGDRKWPFEQMEQTFFATFGFRLPRLEWVPSPALPPETVAVKIDAWWSLPLPMLPRGQRLVNAPPDVLRDFDARVGLHPLSGEPCALVEDRFKDTLESVQIETWGPVDFVSLSVLAELSRRPARLLGIEDVEYQLAQLQEIGFNQLVDVTLARYTLGELTRVFRALLDERLSLRDLRGLLERLVQFDVLEPRSDELDILDERLPVTNGGHHKAGCLSHYAFLRRQLQGYLSHKYTWHANTIVAYTLDPRLESRMRGSSKPLDDDEVEAVRDAVWTELQSLPPSPYGQVLLTASPAREAVRRLFAPELPDLPILSRSELRRDATIQSVATITLT